MPDGIASKGIATLGKSSNGIGSLGIGRIFGGVPYWSLLTQRNKGVDETTELVDTLNEAFVSRANYVNSNCYKFETDQYLEFTQYTLQQGDVLSFWARRDATGAQYILGNSGTTTRYISFVDTNRVRFRWGDESALFSLPEDATDGMHFYEILLDWDALTFTLWQDLTLVDAVTLTTLDSARTIQFIGRTGVSQFGNVSVADFRIKSGSATSVSVPLSEGWGVPFSATDDIEVLEEYGTWDTGDGLPVNLNNGFRKVSVEPIIVIPVNGQSNIVGQHTEAFPYPLDQDQDHYYGYNINGAVYQSNITQLRPVTSTGTGSGSIEIQAGVDLTADGRTVCFIKTAFGGTDMYSDWQPDGIMYPKLVEQMRLTLREINMLGYEYEIPEFWWMQGNDDSYDETISLAYKTNFDVMYDQLITDGIIQSDTIVRIAELSAPTATYKANINTAYASIVAERGGSVLGTSDLAWEADDTHLTMASLITLGSRFAADFIAENYTPTVTADHQWFVPPLIGSTGTAADGNALTNEGCLTSGAVHNGAETGIQGTDDDMLASEFFSDDGLVFAERDWADVLAFIWGNTNTWGRFGLDKYGSCALFELNQYLFILEYTVAVYNRFAAYYKQCDESGGVLIPFRVTSGGIGDGTYFSADGEHVLLVEDA